MGEPRRCWLRWHNYSDSVTSALESLRYDEDFLDVTIACDGHSIRAHKLVLSACSAYFKKILKDHPCDHPIIILDGLGWQVIVSLLHFMYCGEVVVEEELLPSLLSAATNLDVTGLTHVTSAIISAQATKDDSNAEHSVEEEEYEDDDDDDDDDYDDDEQPLKIEEVQKSSSDLEGMDSTEGSLSEAEAPPSKRPRKSSCDAQTNARTETQKQKDFDSTKTVSSPVPKESGVTQQKVTNGISPLTLPLHAATPLVDLPSIDSNKSYKKEDPPNCTSESSNDSTDKSKKKVVNGDSSIKNENTSDFFKDEEFYDDDSSDPPENGDSDMLKTSLPLALGKSGVILPEGLLETCVPVGMTSAMGPINYATLVASEGILPSVTTTQGSTVLIAPKGTTSTKSVVEGKINLNAVVQKILFPPIPASATVALSTVPTVTSGTTPATATCAPPTTTSSLSNSTSGQQYIHPSMVSLQEVQATLEQYQRKLAFHEPRPCPTCRRMYRDAATLRTHMAIMHSEGREPFSCSCRALFRTKYDMYQHKKNGHR
ncbi:protein tramtrack, beta isoform-like isoform X1 [Macrobrachium nipponense]|uniref:protein tramtrack, beta isoform-like isoform X1 n=1 Tax=Macrobrachium nipponense TaxID=159736 RepID=UPI0030C86B68